MTHDVSAASPAQIPADAPPSSLPSNWGDLWGWSSDEPTNLNWQRLEKQSRELAEAISFTDHLDRFGPLVGSEGLRNAPVHRWFSYKEGFSPALLGELIGQLELSTELNVIDSFGGVATTALAGLAHPHVTEVRSVEYSPFARFAGRTKLLWPAYDVKRLRGLLEPALDFDREREVQVPDLAAFSNPEIFSEDRIRTLLQAREHLRELPEADDGERDFLLLGLAAVTEDLSGAMKDGRALRIKRTRSRRYSSLAETQSLVSGALVEGEVERALAGQWSAMISDLGELADQAATARLASAHHLPGDARDLASIELDEGEPAFPEGWADLSVFSPPYLNCIDYTELYKIELWLMGFVDDQASFRKTRLGTLRSHPSIRFPERAYFKDVEGEVVELIRGAADWISRNGARREVGPIVAQYFEDMLQVWREQFRVLSSGAPAVCVVANSTFSRRERHDDGTQQELWRLPLLTDVIVAHLAKIAGFDEVEIWGARELRPRNVRAGRARESLVVARKP